MNFTGKDQTDTMKRQRAEDVNRLMTEPDPFSLAELYHENSKLRRTNSRQYGEFVSSVASVPYVIEKMAGAYKSYPTHLRIPLPSQFNRQPPGSYSLEEIIERRRTIRQFSARPLALEQAAKLLHFSYGITGSVSIPHVPEERQSFRAVPSAGALYPLEIYLIGWNVEGLDPGIYHYHVPSNALESVEPGDFSDLVGECLISTEITKNASVLFVLTAIFQRTLFKYNERGYRFVLLEAGHLAQNMCLMATAMNLGLLPIGAFLDDELNRMIGVDGVNESAVYPILIGALANQEQGATDG